MFWKVTSIPVFQENGSYLLIFFLFDIEFLYSSFHPVGVGVRSLNKKIYRKLPPFVLCFRETGYR